ncbi:putative CCR4-associated factor 1 homolog 11 [Castanea sativa]|uniref:putative CCR4-associated factor 1 homolog 11 n=1 Tax=Castanea sativa TaxID=21020 RepID=UPI003F64945B
MDRVSLPLIVVRQVWKHNLLKEFDLIRIAGMTHRMVAFNTEFPGVLGLALCDDKGSLPNYGTKYQYAWEFNSRDFDVYNDIQNTESIELLKSQGINFDKNLKEGVDSADFAALMLKSGLLGMMEKNLCLFGKRLFDLKHMMKFCDGLYGGLETVANRWGVERVAGKSHQAGSDTLLTLQTFRKFLDVYFKERNNGGLRHSGHLLTGMQCVLHGLEWNNNHQLNNAGLKLINAFSHGLNVNMCRVLA